MVLLCTWLSVITDPVDIVFSCSRWYCNFAHFHQYFDSLHASFLDLLYYAVIKSRGSVLSISTKNYSRLYCLTQFEVINGIVAKILISNDFVLHSYGKLWSENVFVKRSFFLIGFLLKPSSIINKNLRKLIFLIESFREYTVLYSYCGRIITWRIPSIWHHCAVRFGAVGIMFQS